MNDGEQTEQTNWPAETWISHFLFPLNHWISFISTYVWIFLLGLSSKQPRPNTCPWVICRPLFPSIHLPIQFYSVYSFNSILGALNTAFGSFLVLPRCTWLISQSGRVRMSFTAEKQEQWSSAISRCVQVLYLPVFLFSNTYSNVQVTFSSHTSGLICIFVYLYYNLVLQYDWL